MCGIAGIVGPGACERRASMDRMLAALAPRGPDGHGVWASPSGLCLLGHRRLSILDLTDCAAQPMHHADPPLALTFNGEIYNYRELRNELEGRGARFSSTGDTETLLAALAERGRAALESLNGMFAFGLWDERARRLLLARDPFGQKPLYYAYVRGAMVFASELRALTASGLIDSALEPRALLSYLAYGAVHEPATILRGARMLEPARWLEFDPAAGSFERGQYWRPPTDKTPTDPERLRDQFTAAVRRHMISDAPIGVFLSGGIDSSAIAAAAARVSERPVITLGVTFPDAPDHCENAHARRVATLHATDHREVPVTSTSALAALPTILDAMDQPTIDGVNTAVVSRAAREAGLKVALSGLGGDELFGGYPSFRDVPALLALRRALGPVGQPVAATIGSISPCHSRRSSKLVESLRAGPDALSLCLARRRLFSNAQLESIAPGLAALAGPEALPAETLDALRRWSGASAIHDVIGLTELRAYMGQILLRDADAMAMSVGLEVRAPFLDLEFVTAALRLESSARRPGLIPKRRFVEAMGDWLPRENTRRAKRGFTFPFAQWMTRELRPEIEEGLIGLRRLDGLIVTNAVDALWRRFLARPDEVGWSRPWSLFVLGRHLQARELSL